MCLSAPVALDMSGFIKKVSPKLPLSRSVYLAKVLIHGDGLQGCVCNPEDHSTIYHDLHIDDDCCTSHRTLVCVLVYFVLHWMLLQVTQVQTSVPCLPPQLALIAWRPVFLHASYSFNTLTVTSKSAAPALSLGPPPGRVDRSLYHLWAGRGGRCCRLGGM